MAPVQLWHSKRNKCKLKLQHPIAYGVQSESGEVTREYKKVVTTWSQILLHIIQPHIHMCTCNWKNASTKCIFVKMLNYNIVYIAIAIVSSAPGL